MKLRIVLSLAILSAIIVVIGGIFKLLHWIGAESILLIGLVSVTVSLLVLMLKLGERDDRGSYSE